MEHSAYAPSVFKRWIMFNSVGAMGIVVQITVLWILASHFQIGYLLATGLAVEAAILHNFFWHERWTWADRTKNCNNGFLRRFLYFHTANGVISLAGNLLLMQLFVGKLGMHYMPANLISVATCAIFNFLAGNQLVYRSATASLQKGGKDQARATFRLLSQVNIKVKRATEHTGDCGHWHGEYQPGYGGLYLGTQGVFDL